ncbi:hypothetical protein [Sinorhizobium saheli]|uniref:hypothetical protein n=1 Tax=Sinorhizobium saheli TaxID=36856 RepID=UPI00142B61FD|nr:hypothetical protein [Sinorhizobium saheli]
MSVPGKSNRPTHDVFVVEGEGNNAYWTKIGAAWPHDDGDGFNISLIAMPIDGKLTVRKKKPKSNEGAAR